jgi:hypothetical protein
LYRICLLAPFELKQMFVRLGTHKSSIYGVMDLTSGYHQAPLSLATRLFTAFIMFCGVFHYLRLPFGPKRAPSYFQEMTMAAVVLAGLVYFICEIYLDDCIVHAADKSFLDLVNISFFRNRVNADLVPRWSNSVAGWCQKKGSP